MTLHLYSFQPDLPRLMRLAARERLLPRGDDPGYAIHAVLAASFGALAPKPWALLMPGQGGGPSGRLLGYGKAPLDSLLAHAATYADPAFAAPLALDCAAGREMPTQFALNSQLGFRVRLRPVARMGKQVVGHANAPSRESRERDVFLSRLEAVRRTHEAATALAAHESMNEEGAPEAVGSDGEPTLSRAACYLDWLDARLQEQGAALTQLRAPRADEAPTWDARVNTFRFTRLMNRDRRSDRRRARDVEGPDATVSGQLVVRDPVRFAAGLARGVGRFRSFGFGMLLLSPPRR
jgi:CRISPR system Cascade subunit CasE